MVVVVVGGGGCCGGLWVVLTFKHQLMGMMNICDKVANTIIH